jgi:hypothetical protein
LQITVTIPDEVVADAQARGLTPESYVEKLIANQNLGSKSHHDLASSSDSINTAQRLDDLERFFEGISAHSDKIPLLPDEAFTRESIYSDHD